MCVFNELLLWSQISSEHPIFIKTVAELTKKSLREDTLEKLMGINKMFTDLVIKIKNTYKNSMTNPHENLAIYKLINNFLIHDQHILSLLPELKTYGKEDKVWQELLNHITSEQRFMYELFTNLKKQLQ